MADKNLFETLSAIDVSEHVERKNGLDYLSWAWAWITFKKHCPDATYTIKKHGEAQLPYVFDEKTGYMVYTSVTAGGDTHEMWLPVMDSSNKAMKAEPYTYRSYNKEKTVKAADMFDVNKALMRCLVKNLAMFGLGISLYAGEDLPQVAPEEVAKRKLGDEPIEMPTSEEFEAAMKKASDMQKKMIVKMCEEQKRPLERALAYYKVKTIDDLTTAQANEILEVLKKKEMTIMLDGVDEGTSDK